jgi:hypothetical protein
MRERMPNRMHRVCRLSAMFVAVASSVASQTATVCASNRVGIGVPAGVPLIGLTHPRAAVVRMTSLPLRRLVSTSVVSSPIRVLPLVGQAGRTTPSISAWLPRLGVAAFLAASAHSGCALPRRPVELSVLPATPFVPGDCAHTFADAESRRPPTSLVAGHRKDALYGPAFTATSDELHE